MTSPADKWQAVAGLRVSLLTHVRVVPQSYRDTRWFLLKNEATAEFTRLNAAGYALVSRFNSNTTVEQAVNAHNSTCPEEERTSQATALKLISLLLSSNLLKVCRAEDPVRKSEQAQRSRGKKLVSKIANPLFVTVPLFNPDKLLDRCIPHVRWLFTTKTLVAWLMLLTVGLLVAFGNHPAIARDLSGEWVTPNAVISTLLIYIVLKALHELSHAFAIKHWGGEVNSCGISFLVFSPIPYVDASSAWEFKDKSRRILVSAAGVITELAVASVAIIVWYTTEPGTLSTLALNVALVASVSTVLFNANPLLKFDGYYVLQDWLEIPNLYGRAKLSLVFMLKKHLLAMKDENSPTCEKGEKAVLLSYGVLSLAYRLFLLAVITVFLVNEFLVAGVLIAIWAVFSQLIRPVCRAAAYLLRSPALDSNRPRAFARITLTATAVLTLVFLVPMPNVTTATGTVWVDDQAAIYSAQDGALKEIFTVPGSNVEKGRALFSMDSPTLDMAIEQLEARRDELKVIAQEEFLDGTGRHWRENERIKSVEFELRQLYQDREALVTHAEVGGVFFSPDLLQMKHQHYRKGEFMGYVFSPENVIVRAIFAQSDIGGMRENVDAVEIRFADNPGAVVSAELLRETPAGSTELPSQALGAKGGGDIAVLNQAGDKATAEKEYFNADFSFSVPHDVMRVGGIAHIRIVHTAAPLFDQFASMLKHQFLTSLNV